MRTLRRVAFLECLLLWWSLGACSAVSVEMLCCGRGLLLPPPPPPPPPPHRPRTLTWTETVPPVVHPETLQWEGLARSIAVMSSVCVAMTTALLVWIRARRRQ